MMVAAVLFLPLQSNLPELSLAVPERLVAPEATETVLQLKVHMLPIGDLQQAVRAEGARAMEPPLC
jgi:hypothetical protein